MNPNCPSPEDFNLPGRSARIEQRLKQLEPRAASFDAATILRAARQADQRPTLSDRTARTRNARSARWMTLTTACACGVITGALLTYLVLMPGNAGDATSTSEGKQVPEQHAAPDLAVVVKNETPNESTDKIPREDFDANPQWSRSEWLVSAQLLELREPRLTGEPPLMAGNYVLHSTWNDPRVEDLAIDEPQRPADSEAHAFERPIRPTLPIDRRRLLDELLGVRPSSRL